VPGNGENDAARAVILVFQFTWNGDSPSFGSVRSDRSRAQDNSGLSRLLGSGLALKTMQGCPVYLAPFTWLISHRMRRAWRP